MKILPRLTLGVGDRFGLEGEAQLSAIQAAVRAGFPVHPVWNKSNREHTIIGSEPQDLRAEADAATRSLGWTEAYFVDADHINLQTVDRFIGCSDFFTLDVADYSGRPAPAEDLAAFSSRHARLVGSHPLPNLDAPVIITAEDLRRTSAKFLWAMQEAGRIYRHVLARKGDEPFAVEVSVDETDTPQTPAELLLILAMISDEGIPAQTIAPKFTGRFNKGVDYQGDLSAFEREFDADLAVIRYAVEALGLPPSLKISVHSGSDKFSLYPIIRRLMEKHGAGLHLKTAGTTWLEEVTALAEADGDGLALAKEIYAGALGQAAELIAPYAPVVEIDVPSLPSVDAVAAWTAEEFVGALDHTPGCPAYNPQFRQFIHVSFKVAAAMGARFTDALRARRAAVGARVRGNLLHKHLEPLFGFRSGD